MSGMDPATDWITGNVNCGTPTCSFEMTELVTIVVGDNIAPVPNVSSLPTLTAQCQIANLTAPTASDNCAGTITATHNATLPIVSNSTIIWTYKDGSGNIATQNQSVVLTDLVSPVANVPVLGNIISQCQINSLTAPTATDNCAGTILGTHNATFPITSSIVITWTYTDGHSTPTTQTQSIFIQDNIAPVPTLVNLPTINSQCQITSFTAPTALDNCSGLITGTHTVSLPLTASTTIVWTYSDGHGNTETQFQSVFINDNIAPVKDVANLISLSAQCEIPVLVAPTATDNCAGTITGVHNVTLPITTTTTITWTYNDGHGNSSTQTQQVFINDNTLPVVSNLSLPTIYANCELNSLTAPTAIDNCSGLLVGTHNQTFPITANTIVNWTYDDGHGNILTQNQLVEITNASPVPDASSLPDLTAQCSISTLVAPTATDLCSGVLSGDQSHTLPITSSTVLIWTFDDGDGNISTQTQNVIINDNQDPIPTNSTLQSITTNCPIFSLTPPTATDNCFGLVTGTHTETLPITASKTITWTFTDGNGNSITQDQIVTITTIDVSVIVLNNAISANYILGNGYQWVDCNNGNSPILGANSPAFTPLIDGSYAVEITVGTCFETSACTSILGLGINENVLNGVTIYPNPVLDNLVIETEFEVYKVEVFTITGDLILADNQKTVGVSNLAPGVYILKMTSDKGTMQSRFVKN
jgi:hypothetical protein